MVKRVACPSCGQLCRVERSEREHPMTCPACGRLFLARFARREASHQTRPRTTPVPDRTTGPVPPPLAEPAERSMPSRVGRFRIERLLGAGAFGKVYLAVDPVLDRHVALKVLQRDAPGGSKARVRFLREAKSAAQLRHPNIVPVFDAGTDGDTYYLAAECIHGRTLDDERERHPQDWDWAADVCRRLAEALAYAHGLGIVHRDVKSNNVMVDRQGEVHLMDFGLARRLGSDERLTRDGAILGTAAYMAPEQVTNVAAVGPSSDQYSLGIVLYELMCGAPPFSGPTEVVLFNAVHTEPTPPHKSVPEVPRDLEAICLKAISKHPEDRYSDCVQLAEDLRRWLANEPLLVRPAGPVERLNRWAMRSPMVAGLTAVVTVLLMTMALVTSTAYWRLKREGGNLQTVKASRAIVEQQFEEVSASLEQTSEELETTSQDLAEKSATLASVW